MPLSRSEQREKGVALVIALLVMGILLLLGTAFLTISSTETQIAFNERNAVQAFFLADAGANKAISRLNADVNYPGETDTPLGPGTFTVVVTPGAGPDQKVIEATGYVPNSAALIKTLSTVKVTVEPGSVFNKGLFGKDEMEVKEDTVIDSYDSSKGAYGGSNVGLEGDIGSNGDIELKEDVTVRGDVIAGDDLETEGGVVITGVAKENAPPITLPPVSIPPGSGSDMEVPKDGSQTLNPGTHGKLAVKEGGTISLSPGTYYFYGDMKLEEDSTLTISPAGQVTIYLTAKFEAKRDVQINADAPALPAHLLIYSSGDEVELGEDAVFYGAIYAPNADIEVKGLDGNASEGIFGALIGKEIEVKENQKLHFDEALLKEKTPYAPFRPVAGTWQEVLPSS